MLGSDVSRMFLGISFSAVNFGVVNMEPCMDGLVGVIYYGNCNYYVLINCIRHCVRGEFIQNYFKIFIFLLIWDKNLGSHRDHS